MNPVPKFQVGQEIWFGGIKKQYNGYVKSISLSSTEIGLESFYHITYTIDTGSGKDKCIQKNENSLFSSKEELNSTINILAKENNISLSNFEKKKVQDE